LMECVTGGRTTPDQPAAAMRSSSCAVGDDNPVVAEHARSRAEV
jgi:hypothetical protein